MIIRATAFALLFGLCACGPVENSTNRADGPKSNAPESFIDVDTFTTKHGHDVWLVNEPSIPIVSLSFGWPDGHYFDDDATYGVSDTVAYMMNEGAGALDSVAFATAMEEQNMQFGCNSAALWTSCSSTFLLERMTPSIDLVKLALHEPRFDPGPIERKMREDLAGIESRVTSPSYLARKSMREVYYPDHQLARQITKETLEATDQAKIKARYEEIFSRGGVKIVAVGAITRAELEPILDKIFGGLTDDSQTSSTQAYNAISISEKGQADPVVTRLSQPQALVQAMGPGIKRENPDFYAAVVANQIFGGSATSRLFKSLRTDKGLTYGVYSGISQSDLMAVWRISGQVRNEKTGEFIRAIKEEMSLILDSGPTQEELNAAKDYIIGSYPLGFDSNAKIAGALASAQLEGLDTAYFNNRNSLFESVTLEDVNRVIQTYLKPERFTFVVVGEPEGLEASSVAEVAPQGE